MFKPLSLLLALWCLLYLVEDPLTRIVQAQFGLRYGDTGGARRHESVLYWLDSDWLSVFVILRRHSGLRSRRPAIHEQPLAPRVRGGGRRVGSFRPNGNRSGRIGRLAPRRVGARAGTGRRGVDQVRLMTNWPVLFSKGSDYIGAAIGIMVGTGLYFADFWQVPPGLVAVFAHGPRLVCGILAAARVAQSFA